jgi:predicted ester cyclase
MINMVAFAGMTIRLRNTGIFHLRDGKIAKFWIRMDALVMRQQLCMELKPIEE